MSIPSVFSAKKCNIMPVRGIVDPKLVKLDLNLKIEETCTDLGLILDKNWKWHNPIENRSLKI